MTFLTAIVSGFAGLVQTLQQNQTGAFLLALILAALGFCIHSVKASGKGKK